MKELLDCVRLTIARLYWLEGRGYELSSIECQYFSRIFGVFILGIQNVVKGDAVIRLINEVRLDDFFDLGDLSDEGRKINILLLDRVERRLVDLSRVHSVLFLEVGAEDLVHSVEVSRAGVFNELCECLLNLKDFFDGREVNMLIKKRINV